tara:strand:- start:1033 stop:1170 length:138 start_codon:yes stop_codon:yes gene_type:complete
MSDKLKNPLYALLIANDNSMRTKVLSGEKEISIRAGFRDYRKEDN